MTDAQKFTKIDDSTYIIEGKVIEFQPKPYNVSTPDRIQSIKELAKQLYDMNQGFFPRLHGEHTITVIMHDVNGKQGMAISQAHVDELSNNVSSKIKAVMGWE